MTASSERIDEKSDNSLIFDIREGDGDAADGLYRRYATRIRGLVHSQMGDALYELESTQKMSSNPSSKAFFAAS
jgi:hypothetical protein